MSERSERASEDSSRDSRADRGLDDEGEDARRAAARRLVPAEGSLASLDRLAALAARLMGVASAQVSLISDVRTTIGGYALPGGPVGSTDALDRTLCVVPATTGGVLAIDDARADPRSAHLPEVANGVIATYLGVPLVASSGHVVGTVCVLDPSPRTWGEPEVAAMTEVATSVVAELELAARSGDYEANRVLLDLAVQAAGVGTFDLDVRSGRLDWDEQMYALFGVERDTFGDSLVEAYARIHPDDLPEVEAALAAAVEVTGSFSADYRVLLPGGSTRWIESRGRMLVDQAGVGVRLLGAAYDTTATREAGERLAATLESLAVGYLVMDADWRITYVNAEGRRVLGAAGENLAGQVLWTLFPATVGTQYETYYRQAVTTGQVVAFDAYYPQPLNAWYEIRATPEERGLALYFLDITARRAAQADAEASAARLALLSDVSALLSPPSASAAPGPNGATGPTGADALPFEAQELAALLVPTLADWCTVTSAHAPGAYRTVGWAHRDRNLEPVLRRYAAVQGTSLTPEAALAQAIRTGEEVLVAAVPPLTEWVERPSARTLLETLAPAAVAVLPLHAAGRPVGALALVASVGRPLLDEPGLATAREVARRVSTALDSAHFAARTALLAAVTEQLSATLDAEQAVAHLAQLVVPTLGDWCVISLLEDDRRVGGARGLRDVGWWHSDPRQRATVEDYAGCRIAALREGSFLLRALDSAQPVVTDHGGTEAVQAVLQPGRAQRLIAELAPESFAVLPLRGRGRTVGLLTVASSAARAPISPEELAIAREVADRAGLALDSARLYRQQRALAEGLQRTLLTEPPQPDHAQIVVRYVPAVEAAQVGGDWYDAFTQRSGATVLVIGDVIGHDTQAAAAMGQVRSIVRTLGVDGDGDAPAALLTRTDAAMHALAGTTSAPTATAIVARLPPSSRDRQPAATRLSWSNAGHPPPMVVGPDATVTVLTDAASDLLLGVLPDAERRESQIALARGATVLLYTDGLVERRGQSLDEGLALLEAVLADLAAAGPTLDDLVDQMLTRMLPAHPEDDVALIAVRLHPEARAHPAEAAP